MALEKTVNALLFLYKVEFPIKQVDVIQNGNYATSSPDRERS